MSDGGFEKLDYKFNDSDPMVRDDAYNQLAKDLFKMDFQNPEFLFVMLNSMISIMLTKGIITETELAAEVENTTQAFKLMKYRKNLQDKKDN